MEMRFEKSSFGKRLSSMLKVDFRRMFTTRFLYIMVGICLAMPILMLVMTTSLGGAPADTAANAAAMDTFTNTWQAIGTVSSETNPMAMGLTTMCNINMLYFFIAVLVGVFVADDFRSGYAKNIFTVRAKKTDYVISKTVTCFVGCALMFLGFFVGAVLGGAIAGLPFDTGSAGIAGVVMCMLSKLGMVAVFVGIDFAASAAAKSRTWMSIVGSMVVAMLLYMMVPVITPLDSGIVNVIGCFVAGGLVCVGLGAVSNAILKKTSLV